VKLSTSGVKECLGVLIGVNLSVFIFFVF